VGSSSSTFAGNVDLKSNAGNATKHLRIWNEGTAANDDAVLSWTAQASRTYSMGIHRDSGNLVITNADASVASGDIINIDNSGNSTFAGTVTVGTGTVAAANAAADDFVITGPGTTATGMTISNTSDSGTGTIFFGDTTSSSAAGFRYNHNTGDMAISAEDNVTFDCDNVGIGTTSPDGKLEVAGGTTLGFRLSNAGDSSAYDQVRMTYGGYNSGAPTVTFMPLTTPGGGNVDTTFHFMNTNGINANNNRANVNIDGILYVGSGRQSGETTLIMRNYDDSLVNAQDIQNSIRMSGRYWSGSASQLVETRINSVHQESNGNGGSALTFMTQTGGSAVVEQMRIDKVGNVGIGLTNPSEKLDVNGRVKWVTATGGDIYLFAGSKYYLDGGSNTYIVGESPDGDNIGFVTGGSTAMTIDENQNVGIGTTSPASVLEVYGGSSGTNDIDRYVRFKASNGEKRFDFYMGGTGNASSLGMYTSDGTTQNVQIASGGTSYFNGGNVGIGNTNPSQKLHVTGSILASSDVVAFSDKKLKENIKTLDGSKVYDMRGVSFTRKDTGKDSSGVIAQEIQKIAPELVTDNDGTLSVAYGNLTGYLIEAVKELKAEIEELKKHSCDCKK